jgi:hypothetical protein
MNESPCCVNSQPVKDTRGDDEIQSNKGEG